MKAESNQTTSVWLETAEMPRYPKLGSNVHADVCVIGAGIAGMMTAYLAAKAGQSVVVIDDGAIGNGETGRTTAHITAALDDRYYNIERMHGEDGARLAAESHAAAINRAEAIVRIEKIDCDFRVVDGYLFAPERTTPEKHLENIQRELEAAHRAGLSDLQIVSRCPFEFWDSGSALKFPRQAQFHPLKFLAGLARCIERDGGAIFNNSHVDGVEPGTPVKVKVDGGRTVTANAAVVCTNSSITDYVITHMKQAPYRTYVISGKVPRDSVPAGLYWDDDNPYHYVRLQPADAGNDYLIAGGEDHKTGHDDDADARFARLELWLRARFPMLGAIEQRWSGQVLEPYDYMSFTGPSPDGAENVFMHSGDSGNGITHGILAGVLLTDLLMGRDNPWARLYDPKRISLRAAPDFIKENIDVAIQFRDYVRPGEVDDVRQLGPGEGAVMLRDGHRIAVYRDEAGELHRRSAVCTHLKCIVHWNSLEKSWDCPCHGSRFDPLGKVLNGPAVGPLEEV